MASASLARGLSSAVRSSVSRGSTSARRKPLPLLTQKGFANDCARFITFARGISMTVVLRVVVASAPAGDVPGAADDGEARDHGVALVGRRDAREVLETPIAGMAADERP